MDILVDQKAAQWYKKEMHLKERAHLRFFARYGGCSTVQQGFSLGVQNENPVNAGVSREQHGITFFIEESDLWYFDNNDLVVNFDEEADEPSFSYQHPAS
ncbi:hypothetical protein GJU40_00855 [Bacillus lacus]|uniref:Core domain-containing protein n=1 Tax=Metabacillus lacus TaxID=1983721 RepID=A0A7X2LXH3_9BACI|nr:HesB/YadR/YfhF family protein [Metabacillus lacus]MRX70718.1 hypothetical protein [Metabacillus lacus]